MGSTSDLVDRSVQWIAGDPDPETRAELQALLDVGDTEQLSDRMAGTLEFGTAGLRGVVGAGSNRMNRATVIRATRGLADHLWSDGVGSGVVIVGRDARPSSEAFMSDTVGVLVAAGLTVRYFAEPVPTPLVAYAAMNLEARAAVVITASHNPPADNGYKVYDANAAQIIPPTDRSISEAISQVGAASDVPMVGPEAWGISARTIGDDMFRSYMHAMDLSRAAPASIPSVKVAYTPLHGVGGRFVVAALAHAGYVDVSPVPSQFTPDGTFPTVHFPNPEEPGALDRACDLASRIDADLVLANDPDTDRLAVAIPDGNAWRVLTGNQVGVLLADHLLAGTNAARPVVVSSIVSSPMLGSIAASHGARFAQSLTGFKWIWNAALDLEAAGGTFVFGYEEALGYSVGRAVRDKDGISAAVSFLDLAARAVLDGMTVGERLEALYARHGLWVSTQKSAVRSGSRGAAEIAAAMERVVDSPPNAVAGAEVTSITDYSRGADERPRYLPATSLVELTLGDLGRLLVRPSGTEPKLKVYGDLRADVDGADIARLEAKLLARADELAGELLDHLGIGT